MNTAEETVIDTVFTPAILTLLFVNFLIKKGVRELHREILVGTVSEVTFR
jgi:hypothetical protein